MLFGMADGVPSLWFWFALKPKAVVVQHNSELWIQAEEVKDNWNH